MVVGRAYFTALTIRSDYPTVHLSDCLVSFYDVQHFTLRMAEIIHDRGHTTYNDIAEALLSDLNSGDLQAEEKVRFLPRPT